jgi:hypothetical protein
MPVLAKDWPIPDFRHVLALFIDVLLVLNQLGLQLLLQVDALVCLVSVMDQRLHLQRGRVCDPSTSGLHSASDTALRRCCDPIGRLTNSLAAMIRSTEEKTIRQTGA